MDLDSRRSAKKMTPDFEDTQDIPSVHVKRLALLVSGLSGITAYAEFLHRDPLLAAGCAIVSLASLGFAVAFRNSTDDDIDRILTSPIIRNQLPTAMWYKVDGGPKQIYQFVDRKVDISHASPINE
ncbi:MAG: hypothetical protein NUV65_01650 [Candidatus Roizmanbacteria bacterium]|nr:hypothetical protein [Candidatus Roizmanbacteria bacterium]